jgi:hypothetical protein
VDRDESPALPHYQQMRGPEMVCGELEALRAENHLLKENNQKLLSSLNAVDDRLRELVYEAAEACSAAYEAAPNGEGVDGAMAFATAAVSSVLRGKTAKTACDEIFAGGGHCGLPFRHVLMLRSDLVSQLQTARDQAPEHAAQVASRFLHDCQPGSEVVIAAMRAEIFGTTDEH